MDSKTRIFELVETLNEAARLYYVLDAPTLLDSEYDRLYRELRDLETAHPELVLPESPTQRVGSPISGDFGKVKHGCAMLSLENAMDEAELRSWIDGAFSAVGHTSLMGEPKIDGLSLSLTYEGGLLTRAATRGDGSMGEDVTLNSRTIKSIPLRLNPRIPLPQRVEIRGECYLPLADFPIVNEEREASGLGAFQNPRNAAAGSLRQQDPAETAKRRLAFIAYSVGAISGDISFSSQNELLTWLKAAGFRTSDHNRKLETVDEAVEYFRMMGELRGSLPYDIDGCCFKVNSKTLQEKMGAVSHHPRWAVASKFPPQEGRAVVLDIEVSVGRTGNVVPTVVMSPVRLAGTTVTRATAHNQDRLDSLDLRVGDTVVVRKAGEIIPEIVSVVSDAPRGERRFQLPANCPACDSVLVREKTILRCPNEECPARNINSLKHFVSRGAMDIDGLGMAQLQTFVSKGWVRDAADLFSLDEAKIANLPGFGESSAHNLVKAIGASKKPELRKFIFALGIPNVGSTTSSHLSDTYGSLDKAMAASMESLLKIVDVGEVVARSWHDYVRSDRGKSLIRRLLEAGVSPYVPQAAGNELEGKRFVITGTISIPRAEAQAIILKHGGKISSSAGRGVTVVAGENAGAKLGKAKELGLTILDEEELWSMIEGE